MFDLIFDAVFAFNQIGLFLMAFVFLLIGGGMIGYELYWRFCARRIRGRVCGLKVTKEKKDQVGGTVGNDDESFSEALSKQPIASGIFLLLFMGIPLIFVGYGAYSAYDYYKLSSHGVYAQAEVVRNDQSRDTEGGISYKAVLRFKDEAGRSYEVKDSISYGSSPSYPKGTALGVYYDADDPKDFVIDDFWHNMALAISFMLFGSVFVSFIPMLIWLGNRKTGADRKNEKPRKVGYSHESYRAVFEYQGPNGERMERESDYASNMFLDKIPGTVVTLLMFPNKPEKVVRPKLFLLIFGTIFFLPGVFLMNISLSEFEVNFMTILMVLSDVSFIAFKIHGVIRKVPKEDWDAGWADLRENGIKVTSSSGSKAGRLLEADEIPDRIRYHVKNSRIAGYVMIFLVFGLVFGGYYAGLDMIERIQVGIHTSGEIVGSHRKRSSDSVTYSPIVRFTADDGQRYKFTDSVGSSHPTFKNGDAVDVLYMLDDPQDAMIDRGIWNWTLSGGLLMSAFLMFWFALYNFSLVRRHGGAKYRDRI